MGPRHPQAILADALERSGADAKTRQDLREELYFALLNIALECLPSEEAPEREELSRAVKAAGRHPGWEEA